MGWTWRETLVMTAVAGSLGLFVFWLCGVARGRAVEQERCEETACAPGEHAHIAIVQRAASSARICLCVADRELGK